MTTPSTFRQLAAPAIAVILAVATQQVTAHHSRANFQLDNLVEMNGIVTDYKWANPHIYFEMELENGEAWLIEGHSIPGVLGIGWTRDIIQVGDEVRIGAFPDLNAHKRFALIEWVVTADGVARRGFRGSSIPAKLVADAEGPGQQPGGNGGAPIEPSTDFSGNWRVDLSGVNLRTGVFDPAQGLPLTDLGREVLATYDPRENPNFDCVASGLPLTGPYGLRFDRYADRLVMVKEHQDVQITVWVDESAAPLNQAPSHFGRSIGHLEDASTLVFETTGFTPAKWGVSRGVDSSDRKAISARFELHPNGQSIDFSYIITDPVYLTAPLTRSGTLLKGPDREFVDEPCDPAISSLHLTLD